MQPIPSERDPIAERDGRVSLPWRAWFDDLRRQVESGGGSTSDLAAAIEAICRALGSPDGTPENIPDDAGTGAVIGQASIRSFGQLSDGRVLLTLANDSEAPGSTYCYGTDANGAKGWHPISDALAASANITLTVGEDGVTTPDLADLTDSGTGTALVKITRDAKGRVSGTSAATTDDLAEGAGNLYYTDERADARITAQKGVAGGLATLDASAKLDAGQLPALAITQTFVVNTEAAMLALDCQQGDVAVRTDLSKSLILTAEPASTLANWQELLTPTAGAVTSFNGRTGAVVPASGDYTAAQVGADPAGTAAAIVTQTITDGDTTHAPSADAVEAALAGKMADTAVAARADSSAVQAIASGTWQKVLLGAEVFDSGFYDPATSRFTPPAGIYVAIGSVAMTPSVAVGTRLIVAIYKNGTGATESTYAAHGQTTNTFQCISTVQMNGTTDYLELYARQDSGGGMTISGTGTTSMAVYRIGG